MIRLFDIFFSLIGLFFLLPVLILLWIIGFFENGSPMYKQMRVGINQHPFLLVKFRTMRRNTLSVATHLIDDKAITLYGNFLRRTKLDEIPQLLNVLSGDMSLVGPRPCLLNQRRLIKERKKRGVFKVKPGITGLAQISGVNMKTPTLLSKTDFKMIKKMNLFYYFYYILRTVLQITK